MFRVKHKPTKSEKAKETALTVAGVASAKAQEMAHDVMAKTSNDIAPAVAAKADHLKVAAAPHVATAKTVAAAKADSVKSAAADARAAAAEAAAERREEAEKMAKKNRKLAKKKGKKLDKKATKKIGVSKRQDVAFKAAALRGQASAMAEDKGLTADNVRDLYNDEFVPHIKELLAAAAAAGVSARQQANTAAVSAFGNLPPEAQTQVAKVAPQLAKQQKKKGRGMMLLGLGALGGAGYLFYMEQQKRQAANAHLSEVAIADSQASNDDARTINNPVTDFKHAEDPTVVSAGAASEAGAPGTAATWNDVNNDGTVATSDLESNVEGETRASRREGRQGL